MIGDMLHAPVFGILISFMLGLALVLVASPICRGRECMVVKAPPVHEVKDSVYKIGKKCYKFDVVQAECPPNGAIEAFQNIKI